MISWEVPTIKWPEAVARTRTFNRCTAREALPLERRGEFDESALPEPTNEEVVRLLLGWLTSVKVVPRSITGHANSEAAGNQAAKGLRTVYAVVEGSPFEEDFDEQGLYGAGVILTAGGLYICGGVYNCGSDYLYGSALVVVTPPKQEKPANTW